ncbi:hypothetical protein BYT27DRAFT_7253378 [Phlegmacium glaucopus]|nr:hypothetical protein BYT27DRAFT_7253378 [Phlegmacium glaucopus]
MLSSFSVYVQLDSLYILFEVIRPSSTPTNVQYNPIAPFAEQLKGYSRVRSDQDTPEASYEIIQNGTISFPSAQNTTIEGRLLSAFVKFLTLASKPGTRHQTITVGTFAPLLSRKTKHGLILTLKYQPSTPSASDIESIAPTVEQPHFISG